MEQETSRKLFENGAFCVLLDVPVGSEFGIDWVTWNTDTKFKGLKLIPPGVHYVHYSIKNGDFLPASGFLHVFEQKEVFVRRWNSTSAVFEEVDALTCANLRLEENLKNLDGNLGAYPFESYKRWCGLSSALAKADLTRMNPECGFVDSVTDFAPKVDENNRCTETDRDGLPVLTVRQQSKIGFSNVERQNWWPKDCSARERSVHAQDSSWLLDSLISDLTLNGLLAEFQYSYVTFVIGQVMGSFDQWKQLLRVFCWCKSLSRHQVFYSKLFSCLYFQMETIPSDFMVDIVSSSNVVLHCLNALFRNIHESGDEISESLRSRSVKFRTYCEKKFDWTFYEDGEDDEDEDEKPVLVLLD